jgi:hypothetical protein
VNTRAGDLIARAVVLAFCFVTAMYAFITSSAFAYLQFIKPRVFHWTGTFADWHWALSWVCLAALLNVLVPHLRARRARRVVANGLAVFAGAVVTLNTVTPLLPRLHDGTASVAAGVLALVPVMWIGALDHLAAWRFMAGQQGADRDSAWQEQDGRLFLACAAAAVLLTACYAVLASVSIGRAFEPDLLSAGLARGVGASLLGHLLMFLAAFVTLSAAARLGGRSVAGQYVVLLGAATLLFAALFSRLLGDSVGLVNPAARWAAGMTGASIAASWGGMRLARHARSGARLRTGLDVFFTPALEGEPGRPVAMALVAVLPLAWGVAAVAARIDWDFVLLKSGVVVVWVVTFALVYRAAPLRSMPALLIVGACAAPVGVHVALRSSGANQHTLDRYAVHNPSFLLADGLLRERKGSSSFTRYLRANTGLTDVVVKPVTIDFVPSLTPAPSAERPHVFLLVIDSLRSDYLSPYNPGVRFTPHLGEFASENIFFPNAFTRYGGTGLSMPAIWAGSVLAHKQYVLPFDRMNALEKLVDANGYRRIQTRDHITEALWTPGDRLELERGKDEMDFEFCGTMDELGRALDNGAAADGPLFVQTRSLTLHIAAIRKATVPPGRTYSGFNPPYAYAVERIDACFGAFIQRLKRLNLYDRSVVVLTADHGEIIGEDGRWGHSYHLFPQVIQVPLLIHLPRASAAVQVDRGAVSLSTDITPTIYSVLGYQPHGPEPLAGHSLIGSSAGELASRRRGTYVLSASYGAVYAVVSGNGRRLYIADGVQEQDHEYARSSLEDTRWTEQPVDEDTRAIGQLRIRRHIDTVARTYGIDRPF